MRALRWFLLLLVCGLLQTFLPVVWLPLGHVDWLLIAVVYMALRGSFRQAVVIGAIAGLLQDGLGGDIIGLHGFAKTSVAALIGTFASFLVVRGPLPEAIVTGIAAFLESSIVVGWLVLLGRSSSVTGLSMSGRVLATTVATFVILSAARRFQQRRARRGRFN